MTPTQTCRGFIVLGSSLVLMLVAALAVMHAHASIVRHQDGVRHRQAAQLAFDMAESGLAFAQSRLNDTSKLAGDSLSCTPSVTPSSAASASARSFRRWHFPFQPTASTPGSGPMASNDVLGGVRVRCQLSPWPAHDTAAALECECSRADALDVDRTPVARPSRPGFLLSFERSTVDPWAVQINSLGCRDLSACVSSATSLPATMAASSDHARVRLSALVKPVPVLMTLPTAALTSASTVTLCRAASSGGLLAHAGGAITATDPRCMHRDRGAQASPLPTRLVASHDAGLAAAADQWDALILRLTGRPSSTWQRELQRQHCVASGSDARERGASILAMAERRDRPCQAIWADGDVEWRDRTPLGSTQAPVLLLIKGHLHLSGEGRIHGVVATDSVLIDTPSLHLTVQGGVVSSGDAVWLGGTIEHDTQVLARLATSGHYVQVQGSWRDVP